MAKEKEYVVCCSVDAYLKELKYIEGFASIALYTAKRAIEKGQTECKGDKQRALELANWVIKESITVKEKTGYHWKYGLKYDAKRRWEIPWYVYPWFNAKYKLPIRTRHGIRKRSITRVVTYYIDERQKRNRRVWESHGFRYDEFRQYQSDEWWTIIQYESQEKTRKSKYIKRGNVKWL